MPDILQVNDGVNVLGFDPPEKFFLVSRWIDEAQWTEMKLTQIRDASLQHGGKEARAVAEAFLHFVFMEHNMDF